jgi:hypothetical protein
LVLGAVLALFVGVWLLINPKDMLRFNQRASRWLDTEKLTAIIDKPRHIERALYRNHRWVGGLVLAGGCYIATVLMFVFNKKAAVTVLARGGDLRLVGWLIDALFVLLVLCSVLAVVLGVLLLLRPSLLKNIEAWMNRWYSSDKSLQALDRVSFGLDEWVAKHTRLMAVLIILGAVYTLAYLWRLLF